MKSNEKAEDLVALLRAGDAVVRERARDKIVTLGKPAVPFMIGLLSDKNEHMRWEGCKALGSIVDPAAAPALVDALSDESVEIRWLAAEALIALREKALKPLLETLELKFRSPYVREGAHHVLHALEREDLLSKDSKAVLDALRYLEPKISVVAAARKAIQSYGKTGS
ncbi:MAG TPA: HEAT repeat domain-containing protein [Bacteroidota bacterium]|nr:HEAT repeat domain-containing protein [Bacteroidota bacterium]